MRFHIGVIDAFIQQMSVELQTEFATTVSPNHLSPKWPDNQQIEWHFAGCFSLIFQYAEPGTVIDGSKLILLFLGISRILFENPLWKYLLGRTGNQLSTRYLVHHSLPPMIAFNPFKDNC